MAVLIYKSSKTAKARAAAAKEKEQVNVASAGRRTTSTTRKRSYAKHDDGDTSTEVANRISPSKSNKRQLFSDDKGKHASIKVA